MAGDTFCWLQTRSACNDCCGKSVQRFVLLSFAILLFGVGLWQAAQLGSYRQDLYDNHEGEMNKKDTNAVSGDLVKHAEFAACVTIGTGAAFIWHVLKWNNVTRYILSLLMLGAFTVQLVTLGFASQQNEKDTPYSGTGDINKEITAAGSAGVIACGLALFNLIFIQLLSNEFLSGEGQTNCCDNNCCNVNQDCCMTDTCCGIDTNCSFGRFLILILAAVYFAVFMTRAAVAASLFDDVLEAANDKNNGKNASFPNGNRVTLDLLLAVIAVSAVLAGYTVGALFHGIYQWNVTSQAFVLCVGFVAITFEVWITGYSIKFWDVGDSRTPDQDERYDTIASLTIVSLVAASLVWVASWFYSDNYDSHVESASKANCCSVCGKFIAMLTLAILGVVSFGLYIARAADGGQMKLDQYDDKKQIKNVATDILNQYMFFDAGLGLGMSLFVLVHLFFWNTITGTVTGFGFLILLGLDLLTLAVGSKQQKFAADAPSGSPDLEEDFVSIASLSIIQPAFSGAIAIVALLFSCDYDDEDADRGTPRDGASDEETGTYGTDLSGTDETDLSGATSGTATSASGSDE